MDGPVCGICMNRYCICDNTRAAPKAEPRRLTDAEAAAVDEAVRAGRITFEPGWNEPVYEHDAGCHRRRPSGARDVSGVREICEMGSVTEWSDGDAVCLGKLTGGQLVVVARSSGGNSVVWIDLLDLLDWVEINRDVIAKATREHPPLRYHRWTAARIAGQVEGPERPLPNYRLHMEQHNSMMDGYEFKGWTVHTERLFSDEEIAMMSPPEHPRLARYRAAKRHREVKP
jgi:hypothetical protein